DAAGKFTGVDVIIGSAHAAADDAQEDLAFAGFGDGQLARFDRTVAEENAGVHRAWHKAFLLNPGRIFAPEADGGKSRGFCTWRASVRGIVEQLERLSDGSA